MYEGSWDSTFHEGTNYNFLYNNRIGVTCIVKWGYNGHMHAESGLQWLCSLGTGGYSDNLHKN